MLLTRHEVRDVDRRAIHDYGLPGVVLMENAGRGAAEWLVELGVHGPVVLCCGKGNNGGDGFVIARRLDFLGFDVRVLVCADPATLTGDAAINYGVLVQAKLSLRILNLPADVQKLTAELAGAEWIVDALLGTGATGEVREPFLTAIECINASGKQVLAVDIPSGLDCDTGLPLEASVRATATATFVARKVGFDQPAAREFTGQVRVVDIGIPRKLLEEIEATSAHARKS